jgi:rare lipoprotein A
MPVVALRRPGRRPAVRGLLIGLIASAALAGTLPLSVAHAETASSPDLSSDVDGVFGQVFPTADLGAPNLDSQSIWTAPPLAEYPFERIEPSSVAPVAPAEAPAEAEAAPAAEAPRRENLIDVGVASTYGEGDGFQGRRTACGQRFDTNVPQVAHKSLPCGTMVRVEDTTTGKSVVAQVTDRGPYVTGRVVDLSWAAFSQLQQRSPGLLSVRVYVVKDEMA